MLFKEKMIDVYSRSICTVLGLQRVIELNTHLHSRVVE